MPGPRILIVTPYAAAANNGNWRTAARWARLLRPDYRTIVQTTGDALPDADAAILLHARRSHAALAEWCARAPRRPAILVMTGTDLYRDVPARNADALASLRFADRIVVLQERGIAGLPAKVRDKARVIFQSAPPLAPVAKSDRRLLALLVGHIRPEKDAATLLRAAARLTGRRDIALEIVGGMREQASRTDIEPLLAAAPNVALRGAIAHAATRQRIRRAHVLVVPSRMEGGANVVVEALTAGTPVIASDCDGNVGMLGERYAGYFPVGDDAALAALLERCRDDGAFLPRLQRQCDARAPRFAPGRERAALLRVLREAGL